MATRRGGILAWLRRWWAALAVAALLIGAGGYLLVTRVVSPPSESAVPQLPWPSGVSAPRMDLGSLNKTPPDAGVTCPVPKLAGIRGAWVVNWENDNPTDASLVAAQARRLDLLDFFWTSIAPGPTGVISPMQTEVNSSAPTLSDELSTARDGRPCGLRFATLTDNSPGLTAAQNLTMVAELLTQPQKQWEFVQAVSDWTAGEPLLDGITLDVEYGLPQTLADLNTYEQVAGWKNLSPQQAVDRITTGYTNLVWALSAAMHQQHRLMRVALLVQNSDVMDKTHIAPSIFNDKQIADHADQIVVMAYDFHWSTSNPGPIQPVAEASSALTYVHTWGVPWSKLAAGVPLYAYDWRVDQQGNIAKGRHKQPIAASDLTPTQLANSWWMSHALKIIKPGGVYYSYSAGGHTHIVWDSGGVVAGAVRQVRQTFPGIGMMVWKIGNADPVGWTEVARALG